MTLIFCDSFDHYATADMGTKWSAVNSSPSIVGGGRFGSCMYVPGPFDSVSRTVAAQATYVVGFAYQTSYVTSTNVPRVVRLYSGGTEHLRVFVNTDSKLTVQRGDNTTLGATTATLSPNVWYYIEVKATIHDSTGVVVIRINGVTSLNLSSQDTQNGGSATIDTVLMGGGVNTGGGNAQYFDDFYICDTNGSTNNDFLGDVRVQAIFPDGNGNSSQLVGSDSNSTDNYLLVDEATPSDSDYVESSTVGEKDTYTYGAVTPTAGTVYGLQIVTRAAKTDAGTRSVASIARLSGTEVDSADKALSTTYLYYPDIRETKPGGGAWSISDVNSAEFGVKVTA